MMITSLHSIFTPKQVQVINSYRHDNWRYLILSGAVRSGKTFVDNYLFISEIYRVSQRAKANDDPHPQYILAGFSSNTIYTNVIASLNTQFGIELSTDRHGHYHLFGVDIVPAYTGSIRGMSAVRGMTSYGAYLNEASLATHDVFQEIIDRCSVEGSHIICDTNPDNPEHWLKKGYIDNKDPKARIKSFSFTIDDNTHLSKEYVDTLKATTPSGMFYDRRIKGLWVTGEGAIFRDFDERKMVVDNVPKTLKYTAGIDWGYNHPCSITVFGEDEDGKFYLVEEHTERFKEIDYWTDVAHGLQNKYGQNMPFYADTARPEHIDHFKHAGINCLYGWKSVVPGIETVAELMKGGRFFVLKGHTDRFMEEIYNYQWDDKAEDKPVKENDHVMDSMRYCLATQLHLKERKTYHPASNDREGILRGMRKLGL